MSIVLAGALARAGKTWAPVNDGTSARFAFSFARSAAVGAVTIQTIAFLTPFVFGSTIHSSVLKPLSAAAQAGTSAAPTFTGPGTGTLLAESSKTTLPFTVDHLASSARRKAGRINQTRRG